MSNPTDPTASTPDAQPTDAHAPVDPSAQPTEAYAPVDPDVQPTEVYGQPVAPPLPPYAEQATQAYAGVQPAYGAPAPKATDTRSKTLAWIALGAGILGFVLVLVAFIPLLWVSLVLVLIGGALLLGALIVGIIALAGKKHGGKGLGIAAIIVSVVGGVLWIVALVWALAIIGLAAAGTSIDSLPDSTIVESEAPVEPETETETETGDDVAAGAYDEAAYLAQVRPELVAIMQEVDPSVTEELLSQIFTDESLVSTGQSFLLAGDTARDTFVSSMSGADLFTEDQAIRFYDVILGAAQAHLVE
ncbi:hypothetical protein GCM10009775_06200 [Microbacterium aoyamense]|uniref:DUF4190 domain-containing protein n=1 Tax=Microbacterium aoyamense TaxID=344166 RepID=A0ABP5AR51_9MICO|nr:hypothetical protein [Microbacterium aoyamense]